MKLSEAIRLGSLMKPQLRGTYYDVRHRVRFGGSFPWIHIEEEARSCALGAAYDAVGGMKFDTLPVGTLVMGRNGKNKRTLTKPESIIHNVPEWVGVLGITRVCPMCGIVDQVTNLIPHMNDMHHWTREQIAGLVAESEAEYKLKDAVETEDAEMQLEA